MNANDIAVLSENVPIMAALGWWFFGRKNADKTSSGGDPQTVLVTVRGGFHPNRIRAQVGVPLRIVFDRQESDDCTSRVVLPDFGVFAELPSFARTTVEISPQFPGTYAFACGMNMIHGVLDVTDSTESNESINRPNEAAPRS